PPLPRAAATEPLPPESLSFPADFLVATSVMLEGWSQRGRAPTGHAPFKILPEGSALIHVLADQCRHRKHVDRRLAVEHGLERGVRVDHAAVLLVLEAVLLDVRPELLRHLCARKRRRPNDCCELLIRLDRLHERRIGL